MIKKRPKLKSENGFTLFELVVVMAILALLTALVVPKFTNILTDARDKADQVNMEMLRNARALYEANENKPIEELEDLIGDYIREIPQKPGTGGAYTLEDIEWPEPTPDP